MIPSVDITKTDGNVGNTRPGVDGVIAVIAPCEKGTLNQPGGYARPDLALTDYGYGVLSEAAAYVMPVAGNPMVLLRGSPSTAASYGTVAHSGAGTSVVTTGAAAPLDDFDVVIKIITGGTIGVAGIELQYSLDGGKTYSATQALGTANNYTIPNTGVQVQFAAGTVLAGQTETFSTKGPRLTNADLVTSLEALRTADLAWEGVVVLGADADATMLSTLDVWLQAREAEGRFRFGVLNAVPRDALTQTEAQYATAMQTAWGSASSIRCSVGADQCALTSQVRGINMRRPVSLPFVARCMRIDISESPAYVARGPLEGVSISDDRGNPKYHNEALYPGLDDKRLVTLRTHNNQQGVYVNQPLVLSPSGSDWVFLQHVRVVNKACEMVHQMLTTELNKGIQTGKPQTDGKIFILEADAAGIEARINAKLAAEFVEKKRVTDMRFILSRTDDLSGTGPVTVTSQLQTSPLRYIGKFKANAMLVRSITATATA